MPTKSYPLVEENAFLITEEIAPYIMPHEDPAVPTEVQALVNAGAFADAVAQRDAAVPEDYYSLQMSLDALDNMCIDVCYCSSFDGEASSALHYGSNAQKWKFSDDILLYVPWGGDDYPTRETVVQTYREMFQDILPQGFDIESFIADIEGTFSF